MGANVIAKKIHVEIISQSSPKELLVPELSSTVEGIAKAYDLQLEQSKESQAFEIIDLYLRQRFVADLISGCPCLHRHPKIKPSDAMVKISDLEDFPYTEIGTVLDKTG